MLLQTMQESVIQPGFVVPDAIQHYSARDFPTMHPVHWLHSHFAVGGWSPLQRLSGMLTSHMTSIAPQNGFTWHPHRGLEIYTWILEGTLHHEDSTGGEGDIQPGDLQRMFSGEWIEHQELNQTDDPVRVIQIWFVTSADYRGMGPHYQQLAQHELPSARIGGATVRNLIGDGSPMDSHVNARLTATTVDAGGTTTLQAPRPDESLFLYVTDGVGSLDSGGKVTSLGQYDVILARPDAPLAPISAGDKPLHFLSFYLPRFM